MRNFFGEGNEIVSAKNGGGIRFCSFEDATFEDVMNKAISVFFPNDTNYYGEKKDETDFEVLDCSQLVIPSESLVSDYLTERGMYPSKTFFYLKSTHNAKKSKSLKSLLNEGKTCPICQRLFFGENCVLCDEFHHHQEQQQHQQQGCSSSSSNQKTALIGCPLCYNKFPLGIIEEHAANCRVISPIVVSDDETSPVIENYSVNEHNYAKLESDVHEDSISILKNINSTYKNNGKLRIKVRRHKIFEDFKQAISKPWNDDQEREMKVVFTGEPCVDDGGPKRELFTCM